jgi:DNA-binding GntR family transcriptional regulator
MNAEGDMDERWIEAHSVFHDVLLAGCPNPWLREIAHRLRDVAAVYQCWSVRSVQSAEQIELRDAEHAEIANCAVQRDIPGARAALRRHIERTTELLIQGYHLKAEEASASVAQ